MAAARYGHYEVVEILLARGAYVDLKNRYGNTALIWSSYYGHIHCVRLLLENGADVTHKNDNGMSAMDMAQTKGHFEIVDELRVSDSHIYSSASAIYLPKY